MWPNWSGQIKRPISVRIIAACCCLALVGACLPQDVLRPNLQISVDLAKGRIRRLDALHVDAKEVLSALLKAAKRRGTVSESVHGEITISLRDVELETGIVQVASLAHAEVSYRGGGCDIGSAGDRDLIEKFRAHGEDASAAIGRLMKMAGRSYSIAPDVRGTVTVDFRNVQLQVALKSILKQVDATYRMEGGVYQISPIAGSSFRASRLDSIDARDALQSILRPTRVSFVISPEVQGRVSLNVLDLSFRDSFLSILKQVDATYKVSGGVYSIYPRTWDVYNPTRYFEAAPLLPEYVDKSRSSDLVVPLISIEQADIRECIRLVMKWANLSYSIAPEVQGSVTLSLRRASLRVVLQNILRQGEATYRIEGGVYMIIHR